MNNNIIYLTLPATQLKQTLFIKNIGNGKLIIERSISEKIILSHGGDLTIEPSDPKEKGN